MVRENRYQGILTLNREILCFFHGMMEYSKNYEKNCPSTLGSILVCCNFILMLQPFAVLVGTFQNREKTQNRIGILATFHFSAFRCDFLFGRKKKSKNSETKYYCAFKQNHVFGNFPKKEYRESGNFFVKSWKDQGI